MMNSLNNNYIQNIQANQSLDENGNFLPKGRVTTRLTLGEDTRFYIAAMKADDFISFLIIEICKWLGYYIEVKAGNKTIALNINSLAKRLHLNHSKIIAANKQGKISIQWLNKKVEKAKISVLSYEEMTSKIDKKDFLLTNLMQKIRSMITKKEVSQPYQALAAKGNKVIYIRFNKDQKKMILSELDQVFAKGGNGEVRLLSSDLTQSVFKQAVLFKESALRKIENEYHTVRHIHRKGIAWGIQEQPDELIEIQARENPHDPFSTRKGYRGPKYDYPYSKCIDPNQKFENLGVDFHQLFSALALLEEEGILHGDIKTGNILVRTDAEGTRLVHLADFGETVVSADKINDPQALSVAGKRRAFSKQYCVQEDYRKSKDAMEKQDVQLIVNIEKKRDVFALGCVLHKILTGGRPFDLDKEGYPKVTKPPKEITRTDVPHELKKLIQEMIDSDYKKRPTAKDAVKRYTSLLYSHYPSLYAKIQKKIQTEYPTAQVFLDVLPNQDLELGTEKIFLKLGKNPGFYIPATKVNERSDSIFEKIKTYWSNSDIEINDGKDKLIFDVTALAKALALSLEKIKKANTKGKISIEWLKNKVEKGEMVQLAYEEICKKFHPSDKSSLMPKIRSIITKKRDDQPYQQIAIQEGRVIYIRFDKDQKKIIFATLDKSSSNKRQEEILPFLTSFYPTPSILKQAPADKEEVVKRIANEFHTLRYIHAKGEIAGIQSAPYEFIEIQAREQPNEPLSTRKGYIGQNYLLASLSPILSFEELINDIYLLLVGLAVLEDKGILHGNIKPESLLFKIGEDCKRIVHLGNFKSAVISSQKAHALEELTIGKHRPFTPQYSPEADKKYAEEARDRKDFQSLIEIEKKRDVFAMGMTLYMILSKEFPCQFLRNNQPDLTQPPKKMARTDVPDEMKNLIEEMINFDYRHRPTAKEILRRSTCLLEKHNPKLYEKIKRKIQTQYPTSQTFLEGQTRVSPEQEEKISLKLGKNPDCYIPTIKISPLSHSIFKKSNHSDTIEISLGEGKLIFNIKRLLQILHVSEAKIREANKIGKFSIEWLKRKVEKTEIALLSYQEIYPIMETFDKKHLFIVSQDLIKKIRLMITKKIVAQPYQLLAERNGRMTYLRFDQDKKKMILSELDQPFARGGYSAICPFSTPSYPSPTVFKQASQDSIAIRDVKNEYHILCHLHERGKVWGIQELPHELIEIVTREKLNEPLSMRIGYLGPRYDQNYHNFITARGIFWNFEDIAMDIHQLLSALAILEKRGVLHGDIKAENILVRTEKDGTRLICLADFGSAVISANNMDSPEALCIGHNRPFTPQYSPRLDKKYAEEARDRKDSKSLIEVEKKRDVFAMGITLQLILTNQFPFPLLSSKRPDLTQTPKEIDKTDIPREVKDLIREMIYPDYKKRPTAQQAFQRYEAFLQTHHPKIHDQIQKKIAKNNYVSL